MQQHTQTNVEPQTNTGKPREPVFEFDASKNELRISVPYVPEVLSVTLWNLPADSGTSGKGGGFVLSGGTGTKPPKTVLVETKESEDDGWPR
ncbi:hypothetical protein [Lysobacter sp.]|uniref:hypothetical protein n=1 Tax=Lysobacter sp. TaxID=72226 RepID=UPI002D5C1BE1|nr:hypothetical protein [Lysobacter sp.]HZX78758.1 hypothetical protein [Lysobacter sp.]